MPAGRPSKYKDEYADEAGKLCFLGATNNDLADFFNVAPSTIDKWIAEKPEFSGSIKANREEADLAVSKSLYKTALEGNTTAQIFWLKNRQPKRWRDKQEIDHTTKGERIKSISPHQFIGAEDDAKTES
jgi:hypothetical protein